MKMLTQDGTIVEGTPLTEHDLAIHTILSSELGSISGVYLGYGVPPKLANFLISKYVLTPRPAEIQVISEHVEEIAAAPVE